MGFRSGADFQKGRIEMSFSAAGDIIERYQRENKQLREACEFALEQWFDKVYPPDIFIGGPSSDPGVNEVREVADVLRAALSREDR